MYDPVLGRFNSVDPLADRQSSLNPYHYSYNNPILFNDPTGLIGEYFYETNGEIYYLGSDGVDDQNQYLVNDLGAFSAARDANGGLNSGTTQALLESGGAKEISTQLPDGQSEGELFKSLFDKGNGETEAEMKELGVTLIFDKENAVLTVSLNSETSAGSRVTFGKAKEDVAADNPNHMKLGVAHTHQLADLKGPIARTPGYHAGDGAAAKFSGLPVYSVDSQGVLKHVPAANVKGHSGSKVSQTSSLYNGTFSILGDALKTISKDRSKK